MKNLNTTIVLILLVIIGAGALIYTINMKKQERALAELQNQLAKVDTLIVVDSTSVKKLSMQLEKVKLENTMLDAKYKGSIKEITAYNKIIITLQDSIKNMVTTDSTLIDSTQVVRAFSVTKNPFFIEGTFMKQEPWLINFTNISVRLALEVMATENKNGTWETFVTTSNKNIKVSSLDTRYKKYKTNSSSKYILGAQAVTFGRDISGQLFAGYGKTAVGVGYGTTGATLSVLYFFLR